MYTVTITPEWRIHRQPDAVALPQVAALLAGVKWEGTLTAACRRQGMTYRYAWGLIREAERLLGRPLLVGARGRGARLTALGERLAWAEQRIQARLAPVLHSLASEVEAELGDILCDQPPVLRLQASHGYAVDTLRRQAPDLELPLDLLYRDCDEAMDGLAADRCDFAGMHLPVGELCDAAAAHYRDRLHDDWCVLHIARRTQGLIVAPDNPHGVTGLRDVADLGLRFVNRQAGSGTRLHFDLLLSATGVRADEIVGYDMLAYTHAAVAAFVGSGAADVGFGLETPARDFRLGFVPLATERYFFLCRKTTLDKPQAARMLEHLRSDAYKSAVTALAGYDPAECGRIESVADVFGRAPRSKRAR